MWLDKTALLENGAAWLTVLYVTEQQIAMHSGIEAVVQELICSSACDEFVLLVI